MSIILRDRVGARRWRPALLLVPALLAALPAVPTGAATAPPTTLFQDGFESGSFAGWTVAVAGDGAASAQSATVRTGTFAAALSATTGAAALRRKLAAAAPDLSVSLNAEVVAEGPSGTNVPLLRLFDASGARLLSLYRQNQSGDTVWVQHSTSYTQTTGRLPLKQWSAFAVHVVAKGAGASQVEVTQDGRAIFTTASTNLGSAGVSTVQLGQDLKNQPFSLLVDDVVATVPAAPSADTTTTTTSPPTTTTTTAPPTTTTTTTTTTAVAGGSDSTGKPDKLLIADLRNRRLVITDMSGRLVWKWDNPTGRADPSSGPLGVRWVGSNLILATFGTGEVGLIDVAAKRFVWKVSGFNADWFQSPYEAELLPDGNLAVAMRFNDGGRVDVYNLLTGQLVWRHTLSNAHAVTYRTADQSENSVSPTLLIGGWGVTKEVVYAPAAGETGQTVTWQTATEYTHSAIVLPNDDLLTTEGYYVQRINRQGTKLWKQPTPTGQEDRRVAIDGDGNLVYTGAEADRIEFRRPSDGSLIRTWSTLSDGSTLDYPYGIQVISFPG
jgi:hypothetical protein